MAILNWNAGVCWLLMMAIGSSFLRAGVSELEYQVKAAFLFNFARFTEWPRAQSGASSPLGVCVFAHDSSPAILEQTLRDKSVNGRVFVVRRFVEGAPLHGCHILFVSASGTDRAAPVVRAAENAGILTVGETPGFAESGGMIGFFVADNKVRFHINPEAVQRARIHLSAQLLQLAAIVHESAARGK